MTIPQGKLRLPSRWEDLDAAFRGRLKPEPRALELVKRAHTSIEVSGGIRFLPIFGKSGSGKTCAVRELGTHLPECRVVELPRIAVESQSAFDKFIFDLQAGDTSKLAVVVIDQYEEAVAAKADLPTQFVERLALLDRVRPPMPMPMLFIWLTTSADFQSMLVRATSRNQRILVATDFELHGPDKSQWPSLIQETFDFHNEGQSLADYDVLADDLLAASKASETLGTAIERIGEAAAAKRPKLQDLSEYRVIIVWPVTDGQRIARLTGFSRPREGYLLDWNTWFRELNQDDRKNLPLHAYNRARLYFDVRLVPIAAADLHPLCRELDNDAFTLHKSYLKRFSESHFFALVTDTWDPESYSPLREREDSKRAKAARTWYGHSTGEPTKIAARIAKCLREFHVDAQYEQEVRTRHSSVRADILINGRSAASRKTIIELKAFSAENTNPSYIKDQVRITLRRHAQLAGFLARQ